MPDWAPLEEDLKPLGVGQAEAAQKLGVLLNRLNEIVLGKRGITADTALRLAMFLNSQQTALPREAPHGTCSAV